MYFITSTISLSNIQQYLLADFRLVEILCECASLESGKENDLVEILATFYEVNDKHLEFMEWSVKHEVHSTGWR